MTPEAATQAPTSPTVRSRVTNGSAVLDGVDGRSAPARRFRDLYGAIMSDLGGNAATSEGERQLAKRAAGLSVACELLEAALIRGEDLDAENYVRLINGLVRTLSTIGLKRRVRDITPPDPLRYVQGEVAAT